jgi:hypothetical protein
MNYFKEPNKTMQRILDNHKSQFFGMRRFRNDKRITDNTGKNNDPKKQIAMYALDKIIKLNVINIPLIYL